MIATAHQLHLLASALQPRGSCGRAVRGSLAERDWRELVTAGLAYARTDFERWPLVFFGVTEQGYAELGLPAPDSPEIAAAVARAHAALAARPAGQLTLALARLAVDDVERPDDVAAPGPDGRVGNSDGA